MASLLGLKWLSIGFSVFYVMLAVADLAVSTSWYVDGVKTEPATSWINYDRVLAVIITLGFLLAMLGFFGCVAGLNDYVGMLALSTLCVVLTAVGFICVSVYLGTQLARAEIGLRENMTREIAEYSESANRSRLFWEVMERTYNCCGVASSDDWLAYGAQQMIPATSCISADNSTSLMPGCFGESMKSVRKAVLGGVITTGLMGAILIIGFVCNVVYCAALRRSRQKDL